MSSENKYNVKDVMNKVNDLIEKSNSLSNDYKTKHNELTAVFDAFKVMAEWIKKRTGEETDRCSDLINDLMLLIQKKSEILTPEEEAALKKMKLEQKEIMENFKKTGRSLSEVVTDLKVVLDKAPPQPQTQQTQQNGGGRKRMTNLTKKKK